MMFRVKVFWNDADHLNTLRMKMTTLPTVPVGSFGGGLEWSSDGRIAGFGSAAMSILMSFLASG